VQDQRRSTTPRTQTRKMEQKKRKELYKKGKIYGRRWIISTVLIYPMWDDGYSLKDLLEMLQHFFFGQL
jgi:hypothetical protein